jgi:DNA-binding NarL/FixJ family response regulator
MHLIQGRTCKEIGGDLQLTAQYVRALHQKTLLYHDCRNEVQLGMKVALNHPDPTRSYATLTPSQVEIMMEYANGLTGIEIAAKLNLNFRTVSEHKNTAMRTLGVRNSCQLGMALVYSKLV